MMGAFRTLRKMSGGLRLLCGAWGLSAGLMMLPFLPADSSGGEGSYAIDAHWVAWLVLALPAIVPPVAKILTTGFSAANAVEKLVSKIKASTKNTEILFLNIKSSSPSNLRGCFPKQKQASILIFTLSYGFPNFNKLCH